MKALTMQVEMFLQEERGVTAIEYALIASLIAVVIVGAVTTLGTNLNVLFDSVVAAFN